MKTTKNILSIVTAFVMAFAVFGCSGLSFAAEEDPGVDPMAVSEPAEIDPADGNPGKTGGAAAGGGNRG